MSHAMTNGKAHGLPYSPSPCLISKTKCLRNWSAPENAETDWTWE